MPSIRRWSTVLRIYRATTTPFKTYRPTTTRKFYTHSVYTTGQTRCDAAPIELCLWKTAKRSTRKLKSFLTDVRRYFFSFGVKLNTTWR